MKARSEDMSNEYVRALEETLKICMDFTNRFNDGNSDWDKGVRTGLNMMSEIIKAKINAEKKMYKEWYDE